LNKFGCEKMEIGRPDFFARTAAQQTVPGTAKSNDTAASIAPWGFSFESARYSTIRLLFAISTL